MTRPLLQNSREVVAANGGIAVTIADGPSVDAFQRLRVSEPFTHFDSQLQYDDQPIFWQTITSGTATATHLPNESSVRLRIATANDLVIRQTYRYHRYQPGKSQRILMTGVMDSSGNVVRRMGYFDIQNGIFLETNGTNVSMVLRSFISGVAIETRVTQGNWNLDKLDGSGGNNNKSGITLNISMSQIFVLDLEWLAVGRVRVGFNVNGVDIYCHEFNNSNTITSSYMTTANLPLRYEIIANDSATGTHDLKQICSTVISEGGFQPEGIPNSVSNETTTIAITTRRPILTVRPKTTFNSITNRSSSFLENFSLFTDAQAIHYEIIAGGVVSGTSFSDVNTSFSVLEFDVAGNSIFGGIKVGEGYIGAPGSGANKEGSLVQDRTVTKSTLALDIDGNHPTAPLTDNLTIVVTSVPGTSTDVLSSMQLIEVR